MANVKSHQNRIIAYEPGKFKIPLQPMVHFDGEVGYTTGMIENVVWFDLKDDLKKSDYNVTIKEMEEIKNHKSFYGKLAVGTSMTEYAIGFFAYQNGIFFGIEYIGSYGFFNPPFSPQYVSEKLRIPIVDANGVADFLNFYLDSQKEVFGEYFKEYME